MNIMYHYLTLIRVTCSNFSIWEEMFQINSIQWNSSDEDDDGEDYGEYDRTKSAYNNFLSHPI